MRTWIAASLLAAAAAWGAPASADIFRWDTGEVIPGTEGIEPAPGADFSGFDLKYALMHSSDMSGADFSGAVLDFAFLNASVLTGADFSGAVATQTSFDTANLDGADLSNAELVAAGFSRGSQVGADFSNSNLTTGWFYKSDLTDANFAGAIIVFGSYHDTFSRGFTLEQLYSTASYQSFYLPGVKFGENDLSHADFGGFYMPHVWFDGSDLTGVDLQGAVLLKSIIRRATLDGTNLAGANLSEVDFRRAQFINADLRGVNAENASFDDATLNRVDLRGAQAVDLAGARVYSTIRPNGDVELLFVNADERLVIRNFAGKYLEDLDPVSIQVLDTLSVSEGGSLEFLVDADPWNSVVAFQSGASAQLGGALELAVAEGADVATTTPREIRLFDWGDATPVGRFSVRVHPGTLWELSDLYRTGEVSLLAMHDPGDVDGDGVVDVADFELMKANFNADFALLTDGDLTGDFRVNLDDFVLLKEHFGESEAVPEPSAALLVLFAAAAAGTTHRYCSGKKSRQA